jgi:hypothetical protein
LFLWYKDVISYYHSDKQSGRFAGKKVVEVDEQTGQVTKEQVVHISHPHHVGESMCIDEKMIKGKYCTILSNYHLMQEFARWYRPTNIGKPIHRIKEALREWKHKVKQTGIKAFKQVVKMIENHQEEILRYFEKDSPMPKLKTSTHEYKVYHQ